MNGRRYVVMFSSGIGSYWAARRTIDEHGADNVTLLFSDVKGDNPDPHVGEDEDNYRFLDDAVVELGARFVRVATGEDIWEVFRRRRFLGNSRQANCSTELKQKPARAWLLENTTPEDTTIVLGIDWTETHRRPAIRKAYEPYETAFPLCEAPYWDKHTMLAEARKRGLTPPRLYDLGFAHSNCGSGCVKSGHGQFRRLLELMPERYRVWEENEAALADYLGKPVTILRDSRGGERRPLSLTELRKRNVVDVDMDDIGGCGCFVDGETPMFAQHSLVDATGVARLDTEK